MSLPPIGFSVKTVELSLLSKVVPPTIHPLLLATTKEASSSTPTVSVFDNEVAASALPIAGANEKSATTSAIRLREMRFMGMSLRSGKEDCAQPKESQCERGNPR